LQADAALTEIAIRGQFSNQSFFFEGSSNVTIFLTQIPHQPPCRNFVVLGECLIDETSAMIDLFFESNALDRLKRLTRGAKATFTLAHSEFACQSFNLMGHLDYFLMFRPSLDFVDLHSRANGAMRNMDSIPWWRTEIKQGSEVYLQLNDYMIAGEGEDPADNPVITKSVKAEARATCRVLHGKMNDINDISFTRSRNPSIASGSVNDILANYFYFSTITVTWTVPEYSLMQCSVGGDAISRFRIISGLIESFANLSRMWFLSGRNSYV